MCDPWQPHIIQSLLFIHHALTPSCTLKDVDWKKREESKRDREEKLYQNTSSGYKPPETPLRCQNLQIWTQAFWLLIIPRAWSKTKFMTRSWRSLWHHKLNWQKLLESKPKPPVSQRRKETGRKIKKEEKVETRLWPVFAFFEAETLVFWMKPKC